MSDKFTPEQEEEITRQMLQGNYWISPHNDTPTDLTKQDITDLTYRLLNGCIDCNLFEDTFNACCGGIKRMKVNK